MSARSTIEHEPNPITAAGSERSRLAQVEKALEDFQADEIAGTLKLVGPHGEEIELPISAVHLLQRVISHLAHGEAISLVPVSQQLTTQEAADLLNVSRPYLIKLLEQGKIPYTKTGTHRRIQLNDVLEYKSIRDTERHQALDQLSQLSQEMGEYD
jgi:excisionase family DNA binding protein